MRCPKCGRDALAVTGARNKEDGTRVRYRKCLNCGANVKTVERVKKGD